MKTKERSRQREFERAKRHRISHPPGNGFLDVLNVGAGHLTFKFDRSKEEEADKAKKVIADMLKRGYMIFVEKDGKQTRVRKFDAEHEEYILEEPDVIPEPEPIAPVRKPKGRPPGVPMRSAKATAIGPSAGG
jgi:hypothetical protein